MLLSHSESELRLHPLKPLINQMGIREDRNCMSVPVQTNWIDAVGLTEELVD